MSYSVDQLIRKVEETGEHVQVTRDGDPVVVIVRYDEWRRLKAAAYVPPACSCGHLQGDHFKDMGPCWHGSNWEGGDLDEGQPRCRCPEYKPQGGAS